MKLLNKLNGWQRIWLIPTVALQIWGITKFSSWVYPSTETELWGDLQHCKDFDMNASGSSGMVCQDWYPLYEVLLTDIYTNLWLLVGCLAAYVAAYVTVKIVRWVISGFKKGN